MRKGHRQFRDERAPGADRFGLASALILYLYILHDMTGAIAGDAGAPHVLPATPTGPLRIVNWNLLDAPNAKAREEDAPAKPGWRTSFGSERRTVAQTHPVRGGAIDADVILLQGLTSMRDARRLFPARDWRLVVSRQILENDDPLDPWAEETYSEIPTTAVAVRYQAGVRVTAQEHLLELALPDALVQATQKPVAGTAVRINAGASTFWVVSVEFTSACIAAAKDCQALRRFEIWRNQKQLENQTMFTGGRFRRPQSQFLPAPPCDARSLEAGPGSEHGSPRDGNVETDARSGCILRLNVPG